MKRNPGGFISNHIGLLVPVLMLMTIMSGSELLGAGSWRIFIEGNGPQGINQMFKNNDGSITAVGYLNLPVEWEICNNGECQSGISYHLQPTLFTIAGDGSLANTKKFDVYDPKEDDSFEPPIHCLKIDESNLIIAGNSISLKRAGQVFFSSTMDVVPVVNEEGGELNAVIEAEEGCYVVGRSGSTNKKNFNGDTVYSDLFISKISSGAVEWTKKIGDPNYHETGLGAVKLKAGGYMIAGVRENAGVRQHSWIIGLDNDMDTLWTRSYGGDFVILSHLYEHETGDVNAIGTQGQSLKELYFIRFKSNGDTVWTKTIGENGKSLMLDAFALTDDGGFILASSIKASLLDIFIQPISDTSIVKVMRFDGNAEMLWSTSILMNKMYKIDAILETGDSSFLLGGKKTVNDGSGESDGWIQSLSVATSGIKAAKTSHSGNGVRVNYIHSSERLEISYSGAETDRFAVNITNAKGQLVCRLDEHLAKKTGSVFLFDLHNLSKRTLSAGLYICEVNSSRGISSIPIYIK